MADRALGEDADVGGAPADIHQADAQLLLVIGQHGVRRSQLLENDVVHFQTAAAHALLDILRGVHRAGDYVHLGLQTHAGHAQRFTHALLVVDHVVLRQGVQHALIGRNGNRLRRVEHTLQIGGTHFAVADGHDAVGIQAADVVTGQTDEG